MTWLDLCSDALFEIGAYSPGDPIEAPVMNITQRWLNRIIDRWAAQKKYAYAQIFSLYNIVPGLQPHLLGPGAVVTATSLTGNVATYTALNNFSRNDPVTVNGCTNGGNVFNVTGALIAFATSTYFTVNITNGNVSNAAEAAGIASNIPSVGPNQAPVCPTWLTPNGQPRPPVIDGANLVLNSSNPSTDLVIRVRDAAWWRNQPTKAISSTVPTDLYPEPDFPNMGLYFWPIPSQAYQCRLETRQQIGVVNDLTANFVAPPTYQEALLCELACQVSGPLSKTISQDLAAKRRQALAALQGNNTDSPRISSADYGTGLQSGRRGFNWESGI
jgi:hypothetical protein